MYNRYVPTPDGGYVCQPVGDFPQSEPRRPAPEPACGPARQPGRSLLKRLLPKGLEADDLLILLILLLLLLDCSEDDDAMTALLAVAAFLILQ